MKLSLSSFLYFNYTLEDAIRLTAEAGYDGIDIWGGRPHAYRRDRSIEECQLIRSLLEHHHLEAASFIPAQFRYPTSLCSPIMTIREDSVSYIQDAIETAYLMGAGIVSVCPGHTLNGQSRENGLELLKTSLNTLCRFAAQRGIRLALEPADAYETDLVNTVGEAAQLISEVGCSNLGIVLDCGHVQLTGESMASAFQAAGDRLYHLHVDDNNGLRDQHLVPGEGSIDFDDLFTLLRSSGYNHYLCAELSWDYTIDPQPVARLAVERLRSFEIGTPVV